MMKIVAGGIVGVGIAVVGLALAAAKQETSPPPRPKAVAAAAPAGEGSKAGAPPAAPASRPAHTKSPASRPTNESRARNVAAALQQATDAKRHLFVFVYEKDDEQAREGRKTFDTAVSKLGDAVEWIAINRTASSESEFVQKYGLKAAPMPLALSFAPNGVVVGGFVGARLTEQQLTEALASPAMQACLKALQDRKLVFLCAQNSTTKANEAAMEGVNEFKGDERFTQATEIVRVDPSDPAEKRFLAQLQVDPKAHQATTVFLAPPGSILARLTGATTKDALVATLQKASSGCGAGGCGSGCGPKK